LVGAFIACPVTRRSRVADLVSGVTRRAGAEHELARSSMRERITIRIRGVKDKNCRAAVRGFCDFGAARMSGAVVTEAL
jgi:hypothetical protein